MPVQQVEVRGSVSSFSQAKGRSGKDVSHTPSQCGDEGGDRGDQHQYRNTGHQTTHGQTFHHEMSPTRVGVVVLARVSHRVSCPATTPGHTRYAQKEGGNSPAFRVPPSAPMSSYPGDCRRNGTHRYHWPSWHCRPASAFSWFRAPISGKCYKMLQNVSFSRCFCYLYLIDRNNIVVQATTPRRR